MTHLDLGLSASVTWSGFLNICKPLLSGVIVSLRSIPTEMAENERLAAAAESGGEQVGIECPLFQFCA